MVNQISVFFRILSTRARTAKPVANRVANIRARCGDGFHRAKRLALRKHPRESGAGPGSSAREDRSRNLSARQEGLRCGSYAILATLGEVAEWLKAAPC